MSFETDKTRAQLISNVTGEKMRKKVHWTSKCLMTTVAIVQWRN
jgi:hypothetical protein